MNKVFLIGNVGKVDVKKFDNGNIANITLATSERGYKLQNGTDVPEHTDWHTLVVRGGLVKVVESYVSKGTKLAVTGKIRYRQFEVSGQTRYATDIIVEDLELLNKSNNSGANSGTPEFDADSDAPF